MDARLTSEQRQLRDAAAKLAADLGPGSVADLGDTQRAARLEKALSDTGWRSLRSDGASGVEVALVAEELARAAADVPFLGPVLADDLRRHVGDSRVWTMGVRGVAPDCAGYSWALTLDRTLIRAGQLGEATTGADITRRIAPVLVPMEPLGEVTGDAASRWRALALVVTCADLLGAARGAHALAVDYAKVREQYGHPIGTYQAVAHLLAEGLALIEGSISVLRHAAWAVDELEPAEAVHAALVAKLYTGRAARTVCETAIQVHGGIGNTWECLAHVFLRRVLTSAELLPARLEEVHNGLS